MVNRLPLNVAVASDALGASRILYGGFPPLIVNDVCPPGASVTERAEAVSAGFEGSLPISLQLYTEAATARRITSEKYFIIFITDVSYDFELNSANSVVS